MAVANEKFLHLGGMKKGFANVRGNFNRAKITGRVKIVFARFVDYANVIIVGGTFIWQDLVNLANVKVLAALIVNAQYKLAIISVHNSNPKMF